MIDMEEFKEAVESAKAQGLIKLPEEPPSVLSVQDVAVPVKDIEVTAENADEMSHCQHALTDWCRSKLSATVLEQAELQAAYEHAVKNKWRTDTLKRHAGLALKRVKFYDKLLTALEHGYQIVPSFPITAFAIRTERKKPLRMYGVSEWSSHDKEQATESLPKGEGDYKNPFPVVRSDLYESATEAKRAKWECWASAWRDLEFPISMSKPQIMEATSRAMALKIFDDLGILPQAAKADPMILARIKDPRGTLYTPRYVTFIIAWHLNTATI